MTPRGRAAVLVLALVIAACSGSGDASSSTSSGSAATSTTARSTTTTTSTTTTSTTTTVVTEPEATVTTRPPTTEPPPTEPPDTEPPPTTIPFVPISANVDMPGRRFSPTKVTIAAGGTVTWSNSSSEVHNAVSDSFSSGEIAPGGSYSTVLGAPGLYSYHCTFHAEMTGQIEVT